MRLPTINPGSNSGAKNAMTGVRGFAVDAGVRSAELCAAVRVSPLIQSTNLRLMWLQRRFRTRIRQDPSNDENECQHSRLLD